MEIYVEHEGSFEQVVKYMFRNLEKDIIGCVGRSWDGFEELKKMNDMICEVYENMWTEKLRWWDDIIFTKTSDNKFIDVVDCYYLLYIKNVEEFTTRLQTRKISYYP
jgi:hypothetical protein